MSGPAPDEEDAGLAEHLRHSGGVEAGALAAALAEAASRRQARAPDATLGHVLLARGAIAPAALERALVAVASSGGTVSIPARERPTGRAPSQSGVRPGPLAVSGPGSGAVPIVPVASGIAPARPATQRHARAPGSVASGSGSGQLPRLLDAPERLGDYRLVRLLARGGMGAVHEAIHEPSGVARAVKVVLRGGLGGGEDPEQLARLRREAELLARLDHPHVVRVHAAEFATDPAYVVVDLLPGGSLEERLRRGSLPVAEAATIARKLASALTHCHARGVLHRDLKPANVLFDDRGEPRLVDFGLAKADGASRVLTATGQVIGTPVYMSPEQALGLPVDARADVYGLGLLLWSMLAGRPPFPGTSVTEVLQQVTHAPLAPIGKARPEVPPALAAIVERATAKTAGERFASAEAMGQALGEALAALERPSKPCASPTAPGRGGGLVPALVATACLAVLLGVVSIVHSWRRPPASATEAPPRSPTPSASAPPPAASEAPAAAARWTLEKGEALEYAALLSLGGASELAPRTSLHLLLAAEVVDPTRAELRLRVVRVRMRVTQALDRARVLDESTDLPARGPPHVWACLRAAVDGVLTVDLDPRTGAVRAVTGAGAIGAATRKAAMEHLDDSDDATLALGQFVAQWNDAAWTAWLDAISRGSSSTFDGGRLERGSSEQTVETVAGPATAVRALYRTKSVALQPRQFLSHLAATAGVTFPTLANLNVLDDPDKVSAGQRLEVPRPGAPAPPTTARRVVEAGLGARAHARPWDGVVCDLPPGTRFVVTAELPGWSRIDLRGGPAWVPSPKLQPVTGARVAVLTGSLELLALERSPPGKKAWAGRGQSYVVLGQEGDLVRIQFDEKAALVRASSAHVE